LKIEYAKVCWLIVWVFLNFFQFAVGSFERNAQWWKSVGLCRPSWWRLVLFDVCCFGVEFYCKSSH
jgi:hypothetical protein